MARIITLYSVLDNQAMETTSQIAADQFIASGGWSATPPPDDDFPTAEELGGVGEPDVQGVGGQMGTGTWYISRISDDGFDLSPSPVEAGLSLGMASAGGYISIPFPTKEPELHGVAPDDDQPKD